MKKITIVIIVIIVIILCVLVAVNVYKNDGPDPEFDDLKPGYLTGWGKPVVRYRELSEAVQEVKRRIKNNEKVSGITFSETRGYDVRHGNKIIEAGTGEFTYPLKNKVLKYIIRPKLKYEIGRVNFSRADFKKAKGKSITKHVKYKKPIQNSSILRCIHNLDVHKSQKIDLVISNQSDKGFTLTLHGSPKFNTYWGVGVSYLVHNNKDGIQTGNGLFENIGKNKYNWKKKNVSFTFDKPYKRPPEVKLFLTGYNGVRPTFNYTCFNVTTKGFKVSLRKWTTQEINWVKFSWIAKEKGNKNVNIIQSNKICNKGKDCKALFAPPKGTRKYTWRTSTNKNKLIGIHSLQSASNRIRIDLKTKGKNNIATTWADSKHLALTTSHVEIK